MMYSPHILQKKISSKPKEDEFGRPIPNSANDSWVVLCKCRCDNNTTKEFTTPNGVVYRPAYHIVCEKPITVEEGEFIQCMDGTSIRGAGKVFRVSKTNYLGYSEIWV